MRGQRGSGDTSDGNETFIVRRKKNDDGSDAGGAAGNETLVVEAFGLRQEYAGVKGIVADGGAGNDLIQIDEAVQASSNLSGGGGNDTLVAGRARRRCRVGAATTS